MLYHSTAANPTSRLHVLIGSLFSALLPVSLTAAPIVDASLESTIDPGGGQTVDTVPMNAVTGILGLNVIQDWDGVVDTDVRGAGQIFTFTDSTRPDVRLTSSGNRSDTFGRTVNGQGTSVSSSAADAIQMRSYSSSSQSSRSSTLYVNFGDYNSTSQKFDTTLNAVQGAALTVSNIAGNESITVVFYDESTALSTQSVSGSNSESGGIDAYFGYSSSTQWISRIAITRTTTDASAPISYFDDLGFTLVPEPGSLCLGVVALMLVAGRTCAPPRPLK